MSASAAIHATTGRRAQRLPASLALSLLLLLIADTAVADPFVGEFEGSLEGRVHRFSIESFARGRYDGIYRVDGQDDLPLIARRFGERLAGRIGGPDDGYNITLIFQGGALLLRDENGRSLRFVRSRAQAGGD